MSDKGAQAGRTAKSKTVLGKGTRVTGKSRDRLQSQLKKQYEAGASIRSLARSTGRSYGFIHNVLVESHVQLRGRGGANRRKNPAAD
ncbi:helix-turn-helix domain-containing protein [Nocardia thailandica]|uniref:Helix-turn-helix domain-containing protein n=1 Tax=Nocardia thailandica TaxID=257275 RepID=A0ABW6PP40_9NOCA|nr:helix-turn-helix domain-containing protein [Nocardia thailandica]